jgi:hypothetical protein
MKRVNSSAHTLITSLTEDAAVAKWTAIHNQKYE